MGVTVGGERGVEDEFRRTPTWRVKCRISGSGRPLRFELWGAREDYVFYLSVSQGSRLLKELHKRHKVYMVRATVVV